MSLQEDLDRAESAVKIWRIAAHFHRSSPEDMLKKAIAGLSRAEQYRHSVLLALQQHSAHKELTFLPWIDEL